MPLLSSVLIKFVIYTTDRELRCTCTREANYLLIPPSKLWPLEVLAYIIYAKLEG